MKPIIQRLWVAGCMALLWSCSCGTLDPLAAPEPSIVTATFQTVTLFETSALFTIRLSNENPFPITTDGGSFKVILNGGTTGRGLTSERVTIPRLGTATVDVPVHLNNLNLLLKLPRITQTGIVSYDVTSTLYVIHNGRSRRLRSHADGEFVLPAQERETLSRLAPSLRSE